MTVEEYKQRAAERREDRRVEIISKIVEFLGSNESDKSLSMRKIAKLVGISAPTIYYYFGSIRDIATALFIDTFNDTDDKKTEFFDFYLSNIDEAKFVFDLDNGVRLDQIEWFDNGQSVKLDTINPVMAMNVNPKDNPVIKGNGKNSF